MGAMSAGNMATNITKKYRNDVGTFIINMDSPHIATRQISISDIVKLRIIVITLKYLCLKKDRCQIAWCSGNFGKVIS